MLDVCRKLDLETEPSVIEPIWLRIVPPAQAGLWLDREGELDKIGV